MFRQMHWFQILNFYIDSAALYLIWIRIRYLDIRYHIISYHIISYHMVSYRIVSHRITPHHITSTSHHITSYIIFKFICVHFFQHSTHLMNNGTKGELLAYVIYLSRKHSYFSRRKHLIRTSPDISMAKPQGILCRLYHWFVRNAVSPILFRGHFDSNQKGIEKSHASNRRYIKMHHTLSNWN